MIKRKRVFKENALRNIYESNANNSLNGKDSDSIDKYSVFLNSGGGSAAIEYFDYALEPTIDLAGFKSRDENMRNLSREEMARYPNQLYRIICDNIKDDKHNNCFRDRNAAKKIKAAFTSNAVVHTTNLFKRKGRVMSYKNPLKEIAWYTVHSFVTTYFWSCEAIYNIMNHVTYNCMYDWNKYVYQMNDIPSDIKEYMIFETDGTSMFQKDWRGMMKLAERNGFEPTDADWEAAGVTTMEERIRRRNSIVGQMRRFTVQDLFGGEDHASDIKSIDEIQDEIQEYKNRSVSADKAAEDSMKNAVEILSALTSEIKKQKEELAKLKEETKQQAKIAMTIDGEAVEVSDEKSQNDTPEKETSAPKAEEKKGKPAEKKEVKQEKKSEQVQGVAVASPVAKSIIPYKDDNETVEEVLLATEHPQDDKPEETAETPKAEEKKGKPAEKKEVKQEKKSEPVQEGKFQGFVRDMNLQYVIPGNDALNFNPAAPAVWKPADYINNNQQFCKHFPEATAIWKTAHANGMWAMFASEPTSGIQLPIVMIINANTNMLVNWYFIDIKKVFGDQMRLISKTDTNLFSTMYVPVTNVKLLLNVMTGNITQEDVNESIKSLPEVFVQDMNRIPMFLEHVDLNSGINFKSNADWKEFVNNAFTMLSDQSIPECRVRLSKYSDPKNFELVCDNKVSSVVGLNIFGIQSHGNSMMKNLTTFYSEKNMKDGCHYVWYTDDNKAEVLRQLL